MEQTNKHLSLTYQKCIRESVAFAHDETSQMGHAGQSCRGLVADPVAAPEIQHDKLAGAITAHQSL